MIIFYTDAEHLDNYRSPQTEGEKKMDDNMTVMEFIEVWLETFKKNSVKTASFERLVTSKRALANYEIAEKKIGGITSLIFRDMLTSSWKTDTA